jgi:transposase
MKLKIHESKKATILYVIKSYRDNGKSTSKVVEKIGTIDSIKAKYNTDDPINWAKNYVEELNKAEKEAKDNNSIPITLQYSASKLIPSNTKFSFNIGYLFIQKIYYQLGLDAICKHITKQQKFTYNLNDILSKIIYARILEPCSKRSSYEFSKKLLEQPKFDLHHIYRSLDVINKYSDYIEAEVYHNSTKINKRNTKVLYYDCTNYYFEIEEADGIKQYGMSKENRPNPIVQMGLFIDGDGIPLSFCINPGNQNEQLSLKPIEKKIIKEFELSQFVVCTDAGLSSTANRKFNNIANRAFITVQSLKKLNKDIAEWAIDNKGWQIEDGNKLYNLDELNEEMNYHTNFYKERWINENGLEQRIIVTFSFKYKNYLKNKRDKIIAKANHIIEKGDSKKLGGKNSPRKYLNETNVTEDGEVAYEKIYSLNNEAISKDAKYDGFYAVCTNLNDDANEIVKINKKRWEIEESFRIMKNEFKARPVNLSKEDRIKAHFMTCFLSLLIYRLLEKKLKENYTVDNILKTLKNMNVYHTKGEGYIPIYERTLLTDELHNKFDFRTDYEIITNKKMKNILKISKSK